MISLLTIYLHICEKIKSKHKTSNAEREVILARQLTHTYRFSIISCGLLLNISITNIRADDWTSTEKTTSPQSVPAPTISPTSVADNKKSNKSSKLPLLTLDQLKVKECLSSNLFGGKNCLTEGRKKSLLNFINKFREAGLNTDKLQKIAEGNDTFHKEVIGVEQFDVLVQQFRKSQPTPEEQQIEDLDRTTQALDKNQLFQQLIPALKDLLTKFKLKQEQTDVKRLDKFFSNDYVKNLKSNDSWDNTSGNNTTITQEQLDFVTTHLGIILAKYPLNAPINSKQYWIEYNNPSNSKTYIYENTRNQYFDLRKRNIIASFLTTIQDPNEKIKIQCLLNMITAKEIENEIDNLKTLNKKPNELIAHLENKLRQRDQKQFTNLNEMTQVAKNIAAVQGMDTSNSFDNTTVSSKESEKLLSIFMNLNDVNQKLFSNQKYQTELKIILNQLDDLFNEIKNKFKSFDPDSYPNLVVKAKLLNVLLTEKIKTKNQTLRTVKSSKQDSIQQSFENDVQSTADIVNEEILSNDDNSFDTFKTDSNVKDVIIPKDRVVKAIDFIKKCFAHPRFSDKFNLLSKEYTSISSTDLLIFMANGLMNNSTAIEGDIPVADFVNIIHTTMELSLHKATGDSSSENQPSYFKQIIESYCAHELFPKYGSLLTAVIQQYLRITSKSSLLTLANGSKISNLDTIRWKQLLKILDQLQNDNQIPTLNILSFLERNMDFLISEKESKASTQQQKSSPQTTDNNNPDKLLSPAAQVDDAKRTLLETKWSYLMQ